MKKCRIIVNVSMKAFKEFTESLALSMQELGFSTTIMGTGDVKVDEPCDMNIMVSGFRPMRLGNLKGLNILSQTEELWNRRERGHYDLSVGYDRVLEQFKENVVIPVGTENVVYCPYGYSKTYESDLPKVEEDIDGYFYGSLSSKRKYFFGICKSWNLNIRYVEGEFGMERDKYIMRSKVIIDHKAADLWSVSKIRCYLAQAKKKIVLAEKSDVDVHPYIPNKHYIEYSGFDDFKEKFEYWTTHDKERNEFARRAYDDLKENCQFTKYIKRGLKGII